jgi:tRNA pseudouridine38-40 synthase
VRLLVGTLKAVGAAEIAPEEMPRLLAARTPSAVPPMAPGSGLFLASVHYDGVPPKYKEEDDLVEEL